MRDHGPAYDPTLDGPRLSRQLDEIRDLMLKLPDSVWLTLHEIAERTEYPESSVSAQLRHLRKPRHGSHRVDKRRRKPRRGGPGGTWEYRVRAPARDDGPEQGDLF